MFGALGGALAEFVAIYNLRHRPSEQLPAWFRSSFFWTLTILMVLAGGALVVIYVQSKQISTALVAANIGASAPLFIEVLSGRAPRISPGQSD